MIVFFFFALLLLSVPAWHQYQTLQFEWHDVGLMYSVLLDRESVRFFEPDYNQSFLEVHFAPIFFFLKWIVMYVPGVYGFVWLHSLSLAVAATLLAAGRSNRVFSVACFLPGLMFLISPYTFAVNSYTHFEVFGVLGLILFACAARSGYYRTALVFLLLATGIRLDFWILSLLTVLAIHDCLPRKQTGYYLLAIILYILSSRLIVFFFYPNYPDWQPLIWGFADNNLELLWKVIVHQPFLANPYWPVVLVSIFTSFLFLPSRQSMLLLTAVLFLILLMLSATEPTRSTLAYHYGFLLTIPLWIRGSLEVERLRLISLRFILLILSFLGTALWAYHVPPNLYHSPNWKTVFGREQRSEFQ